MTQFDTVKKLSFTKSIVDIQHVIIEKMQKTKIPSSTHLETQLIEIQLIGFLLFPKK